MLTDKPQMFALKVLTMSMIERFFENLFDLNMLG